MAVEPGKDEKPPHYANIRWEGIAEVAESLKNAAQSFLGHVNKLAGDVSAEIKHVGNVVAEQIGRTAGEVYETAKQARKSQLAGDYKDAAARVLNIPKQIQNTFANPLNRELIDSKARLKDSLAKSNQEMSGMANKVVRAAEKVRPVAVSTERGLNAPLMTSMTSAKPSVAPAYSEKIAANTATATPTATQKNKSAIFKPAVSETGHYLCDTADKPTIVEECKKSDIKMRVLVDGHNHFIDFESEEIALRFLEKLALQGKDFLVVNVNGDGSTVNIYDSYQGNFNVTRNVPAEAVSDISALHPGLKSPVDLVNIRQAYLKEEVDQDLIENYVNFTNQRQRHRDDYSGEIDLNPDEIFDEVTRLREKCELKFDSQEEAREFFADQAEEDGMKFMFYSRNEAGKCDYQVSVGDGKLYSGSVEDVMSQLQAQDQNNPEVSKALQTLNYHKQNPPTMQAETRENLSSSQADTAFTHR